MKRLAVIAFLFLLGIGLCSCKNDEVRAVERMINRIDELGYISEARLQKAEEFYRDLSEEEQAQVSNRADLIAFRQAYDAMWETTVVTMDNWSDYFEVTQSVQWYADEMEGADGFRLLTRFQLKEAYKNARMGYNDFLIQLRPTKSLQYCQYDNQSRTYRLSSVDSVDLPDDVWGSDSETITLSYYTPNYQNDSCIGEKFAIPINNSDAYKVYGLEVTDIHVTLTYRTAENSPE